jgi:hypothetical protein
MVVYVLLVAYDYEGCECLGVYETELEALAAFSGFATGGFAVVERRVLGAPAETQS